jgi:hypothetical protein
VGQRRTAGPVAARLESAATRLTSDALTILVCGEFKRGKSTLLNALLDEQEAQELTFNVTWIQYGEQPSLTLHYRDGRPSRAADVEALARHVGRPDGAETGRVIDYLAVTDPAPYLRSFDLVDTPGLDSVFGDDSANTLRFLGDPVDAMVLVVSGRLQAREPDLLADFQDHSLGPTPINAIAALTKVEHLWDRRARPDPMAVGREIAAQAMSVPFVRRVVHSVYPVASLVAAAAAALIEHSLADLALCRPSPPMPWHGGCGGTRRSRRPALWRPGYLLIVAWRCGVRSRPMGC